jgi:repressor LexA
MSALTQPQQAALDVIKRSIADRGYPPSVREMCAALGISINAMCDRLTGLVKKGVIARDAGVSRGIRVLG